MKRTLFILIIFQTSLIAQTSTVLQEQSRVNAMNEIMKQNTSSQMLYYKPSEVDIKGSKYYLDTYSTGEVWFMNGDYISTGYLFKFDEEANSVQIKDKNGQEILADATKINGCRLNIEGKTVLYFKSPVPGDPNNRQLFQLMYNSDNCKVIKLPSKKLITKTKMFHDDAAQQEYFAQHTYFIKKGDKKYEEIKLKKKSLLEVFSEKKVLLTQLFDTPQYKDRLTEASLANILMELEKVK